MNRKFYISKNLLISAVLADVISLFCLLDGMLTALIFVIVLASFSSAKFIEVLGRGWSEERRRSCFWLALSFRESSLVFMSFEPARTVAVMLGLFSLLMVFLFEWLSHKVGNQ